MNNATLQNILVRFAASFGGPAVTRLTSRRLMPPKEQQENIIKIDVNEFWESAGYEFNEAVEWNDFFHHVQEAVALADGNVLDIPKLRKEIDHRPKITTVTLKTLLRAVGKSNPAEYFKTFAITKELALIQAEQAEKAKLEIRMSPLAPPKRVSQLRNSQLVPACPTVKKMLPKEKNADLEAFWNEAGYKPTTKVDWEEFIVEACVLLSLDSSKGLESLKIRLEIDPELTQDQLMFKPLAMFVQNSNFKELLGQFVVDKSKAIEGITEMKQAVAAAAADRLAAKEQRSATTAASPEPPKENLRPFSLLLQGGPKVSNSKPNRNEDLEAFWIGAGFELDQQVSWEEFFAEMALYVNPEQGYGIETIEFRYAVDPELVLPTIFLKKIAQLVQDQHPRDIFKKYVFESAVTATSLTRMNDAVAESKRKLAGVAVYVAKEVPKPVEEKPAETVVDVKEPPPPKSNDVLKIASALTKKRLIISAVFAVITIIIVVVAVVMSAPTPAPPAVVAPIDASGSLSSVTTFAGTGIQGVLSGQRLAATFNKPRGVIVNATGDVFIADTGNQVIRHISLDGEVIIRAGNRRGVAGPPATALSVGFNQPNTMVFDVLGNLYISETGNNFVRILQVSNNFVYEWAGNGGFGSSDGDHGTASLGFPEGIHLYPNRTILICDTYNQLIRVVDANQSIKRYAGIPGMAGSANGPLLNATFKSPSGIAIDSRGGIYISDSGNNQIRKVENGMVSTFAGQLTAGKADGAGILASFNQPNGMIMDAQDNLFIADTGNNLIRMVNSAGQVTTLAGSSQAGNADGLGKIASFNGPRGLGFDLDGTVLVADTGNNLIRRVARIVV